MAGEYLPFGSVYWEDEMPDIRTSIHCPEHDGAEMIRMFSIRLKLWNQEALSDAEKNCWESMRVQVPDWPLFRRLNLTHEQELARQKAEQQVAKEFEPSAGDVGGSKR